MDQSGRKSTAEYRSLATRWRALAAEATTPRMQEHLLDKARECEGLAAGAGVVARSIAGAVREGSW